MPSTHKKWRRRPAKAAHNLAAMPHFWPRWLLAARLYLRLGSLLVSAVLALIPAAVHPPTVAAAAGEWSRTGSPNEARYGHTATLLGSGQVLVVGGLAYGAPNYLTSAEVYDPASGTWSNTGELSTARFGHTATLLKTGKVLVVGGVGPDGDALASAEMYDPASGTWSNTGSLKTLRNEHTATLLTTGQVLVVGGDGPLGPLASAELFDPTTGTWRSTGSLPSARSGHTATLLENGQVLVAGGYGDASAELYDPLTGTWSPTGSLSTPRNSHTATLLNNGQVLVAGGYVTGSPSAEVATRTELYDPTLSEWHVTGSLSTPHQVHTATLLETGQVLVVGTGNGISQEDRDLRTEVYDPTPGTWGDLASLNTGRYGHTATLLGSGQVLVAGGAISAPAELYTHVSVRWSDTDRLNATNPLQACSITARCW